MIASALHRFRFGSLCVVLALGAAGCSSSDAGSPAAGAGAPGAAGATNSAGAANGGAANAGAPGSAGAPNGGSSNGAGAANGGAPGSSGASAGGASAGGAGGAGGAPVGGTGVTWSKVFVTWYGYDDNSCDTEATHTCDNIAYPMSDGFPTKHNSATEGAGTYADPITFAAAGLDDPETFGGATIKPGTIIYYPKVKKYFMLEDSCFECTTQWQSNKLLHVDLWMGPSMPPQGQTMFGDPLINCENDSTDSSADDPSDTIIVDPPSTLEVSQTMLFTGTQCNVPQ